MAAIDKVVTALIVDGLDAAKAKWAKAKKKLEIDEVGDGLGLLHTAARMGMVEAVEWVLSLGADPNVRRVDGEARYGWGCEHRATPLMLAVQSVAGDTKAEAIAERLIKAGAEVNAQDHEGKTALFYAVERPTLVQWLLDHGADASLTDAAGKGALVHARQQEAESVAVLERAGASDVGAANSNLLEMARQGQVDAVRALLDAGADVNHRDEGTPLSAAARYGHPSVLRLLLEYGADVDLPESDRPDGDFTALGRAALGGQADTVELLLAHGADITLGPMEIRPIDSARDALRTRGPDDPPIEDYDRVVALLQEAASKPAGDGKPAMLRLGPPGEVPEDVGALLGRLNLDVSRARVLEVGDQIAVQLDTEERDTRSLFFAGEALAKEAGWLLFATCLDLAEIEPSTRHVETDLERAASFDLSAWVASRVEDEDNEMDEDMRAAMLDAGIDPDAPASLESAPLGDLPSHDPRLRLVLVRDIGFAPIIYRFGGWNDVPPPEAQAAVLRSWAEHFGAELAYLGTDTLELTLRDEVADADADETARTLLAYCSEIDSWASARASVKAKVWTFWWD